MRKNIFLLAVIALLALNATSRAQTTGFLLKMGGGMIVEDGDVFGVGGAIDIKPTQSAPVFSPFVESYTQESFTRTYYGLNLLISSGVRKSGVYVGAGVGSAHTSVGGSSENSFMYDVLLGGKIMLAKQIGIFVQGKFFINSKTDESFYFDNDITANAGIAVALQ